VNRGNHTQLIAHHTLGAWGTGDCGNWLDRCLPSGECQDRIGTGPPRARTDVIYVD
jgi:hypothetical protein